ncbi:peptidoglycan-binding domain-containing protein [Kordia sp.]|uniref:peptidoglycan-binding domain-containing protein n=1 Tax=Kordia sp. TaxID=1965332 RepID=UPI003D2CDE8F
MKKQTQIAPSFFAKHKTPLLIGGVVVVLTGIGITYYVMSQKKKKENEKNPRISETTVSIPVPPSRYTPPFNSSGTRTSTPVRSGSSRIVVKYGSRGSLVRVLQRYLKTLNADLGRTGAKRDGVDGAFGPKTAKASKSKLNKTTFTASDIEKMKKALQTLGK